MKPESMPGLWRNNDKTPEGKYLVKRRDGTIPEWPFFVIGAADPAAPQALRAYAKACIDNDMDIEYIAYVLELAHDFEMWRQEHKTGDPDALPHRIDDPETVAEMRRGHSA